MHHTGEATSLFQLHSYQIQAKARTCHLKLLPSQTSYHAAGTFTRTSKSHATMHWYTPSCIHSNMTMSSSLLPAGARLSSCQLLFPCHGFSSLVVTSQAKPKNHQHSKSRLAVNKGQIEWMIPWRAPRKGKFFSSPSATCVVMHCSFLCTPIIQEFLIDVKWFD